MANIKRFKDMTKNETFFYYNDNYNIDIIQSIIDKMKPISEKEHLIFKDELKNLNNKYPVKNSKRLPESFGKRVAWWVDLNLIQDVIDRMNSIMNPYNSEYIKDLKKLINV